MGFIALFLVTVCNIFVRSRLPHSNLKLAEALPDFRIFRDPVFTLTTFGVFLIEWGLFAPLAFITSYSLSYGVDSALSYQILAILNAGSFFGRWVPGFVADSLGRFNTMVITIAMCLVTTFAFWLPAGGSVALIIVYAVLFGFASGTNISLTPVCVGQLCKTENYGRYYATCYTIVSFGTLTGIPIAGQILTVNGGRYYGLIIFTGMCYAGGLACFTAARVIGAGWKLKTIY
jgi:MFS family permease